MWWGLQALLPTPGPSDLGWAAGPGVCGRLWAGSVAGALWVTGARAPGPPAAKSEPQPALESLAGGGGRRRPAHAPALTSGQYEDLWQHRKSGHPGSPSPCAQTVGVSMSLGKAEGRERVVWCPGTPGAAQLRDPSRVCRRLGGVDVRAAGPPPRHCPQLALLCPCLSPPPCDVFGAPSALGPTTAPSACCACPSGQWAGCRGSGRRVGVAGSLSPGAPASWSQQSPDLSLA